MTASTSKWILLPDYLVENLDAPFCLTTHGQFSRRELLAHALYISELLPEQHYAINLCQDRYLFMVAFLAVLLRGQISLLPPNQTPLIIEELLANYSHSYVLSDEAFNDHYGQIRLAMQELRLSERAFPALDVNRPISISFTSGSTGEPKAIFKTLSEFQRGSELALAQLDLLDKHLTLVSTVPPQHMYGLETSFFWPLFSGLTLHNCRPFYPEDVHRSLEEVQGGAILVATPIHLKALIRSETNWPAVAKILSSTAPMAQALAIAVENKLHAPLFELFGSTETQSFASRRTAFTEVWQNYEGITLQEQVGQFWVQGGHLNQAIMLDDCFELKAEQGFRILGRSTDLIKIAGKRASLAELNLRLNAIDGVDDGVFFEMQSERLSVVVVSQLSKEVIIGQLRKSIDPVFIPRQVMRVMHLPRNALGKIDKTALDVLIRERDLG